MKEFFHYNSRRYDKRLKYMLGFTLVPLSLFSAVAVLVIFVNMRTYLASGFFMLAVKGICLGAVFGIFFTAAAISRSYKKNSRNTRYSFIDIGLKEIVLSKYAGEYIQDGKRIVLREVSIIPLNGLSKLGINEKNGKIYISNDNSCIKHYLDRDERLMYRFTAGKAVFDNWWYNENCPLETNDICLPPLFGNPELLCDTVAAAKKRFDDIPPPKKYVHKEPDFVRRRKALQELKKMRERWE